MTQEEKDNVLGLDEVNTFFLIDECGAFLWHMQHEMSHGRIPEKEHQGIHEDMLNVSATQQFAVANLDRFDVDPESTEDRESGEYWKWYRFWNNWKNEMSEEAWLKVQVAMKSEEPLDEFLPKEKWND